MDDITLGGIRSVVASDVELFKAEGSRIGLDLNVSKCESISRSHDYREQAIQGFLEMASEDACWLGAPLWTGRALDKALSSRCSDLRIAIGRLKVLPSHDALILVRSSFSVPRLMHTLRCVPCAGYPSLTVFDNLLREGISSITNSLLSDIQWLQASLPIREFYYRGYQKNGNNNNSNNNNTNNNNYNKNKQWSW